MDGNPPAVFSLKVSPRYGWGTVNVDWAREVRDSPKSSSRPSGSYTAGAGLARRSCAVRGFRRNWRRRRVGC